MEENKVAQVSDEKLLAALRGVISVALHRSHKAQTYAAEEVAQALIQSQDLRVTLNEPKYHWIGRCVYRFLEVTTTEIAQCIDAEHAREYCEFLNSKEPK